MTNLGSAMVPRLSRNHTKSGALVTTRGPAGRRFRAARVGDRSQDGDVYTKPALSVGIGWRHQDADIAPSASIGTPTPSWRRGRHPADQRPSCTATRTTESA